MTPTKILTIPSGSIITPGVQATTIIPFVDDFEKDETVLIEGTNEGVFGTALVDDVRVETFAVLQNYELKNHAHPEFRTWPGAFNALLAHDPEFQQTEKVTLVTFTPNAVEAAYQPFKPCAQWNPDSVDEKDEK